MAENDEKNNDENYDNKLPGTLKRSPQKAQRTFKKTLKSAEEEYGKGRRASQTAYSSLKHSYEKVGDHWEPKDSKGPSDPKAKTSYKDKQHDKAKSYGGVDIEGSTKDELVEKAKKLGVSGYSNMNKDELGDAINKANQKETAKSRDNS